MPADIEQKAVMAYRAADAADQFRFLFEHDDGVFLLGQQIGCGQTSRSCADNQHIGSRVHMKCFRAMLRGSRAQN